MIHLCFIIDNSLTMDQRPNNGVSLLDSVKSSIQNTLRNLYRIGFPNNHQHIHLFCTSNPQSYLSSFQHDESHLYCQLKSITSSINTDPALTIQTAIEQISKFRILSQAETFKGYRQAFIYQPALIIFISDRMTRKKIMNIISSIDNGKWCMRSQFQFAAYLIGILSYTERNLLTEEAFKSTLQGQKQIKMYGEALRRMNSELKFIMNYQNINNFLWNRIETYKPFLLFNFQLKEMKKKMNQFRPSERGTAYFKAWQHYLANIPFQLVPNKLWKIPLPFNIKCNEQDGQKLIESMGKFKFYLDLSKKYIESNANILPQNKYKILSNPAISMLQNQNLQEKYVIFFEFKGNQCPVGLLSITPKGSEVNFYFANFTLLNSILKCVQAKQNLKSIQANIYTYLNSIPHFYIKFIKIIFDKLNININCDQFQNPQANSFNFNIQTKLENLRLMQKRNLPKIFQTNLQNHQKYNATCCSTYSPNYSLYSEIKSKKQESYSNIQVYFNDLVSDLLSFKKKVGIQDYLSTNQIDAVPMVKELDKYNIVKKIGDDDFNQNITINFGNPYRKKRKNNQNQNSSKQSIITKQALSQNQQKQVQVLIMDKKDEKNNDIRPTIMIDQLYEREKEKNSFKQIPITTKHQQIMKERNILQVQRITQEERQIKTNDSSITEQRMKDTIFLDETIHRFNSIPIQKQLQIYFNPKNMSTEQMLKNEKIMQKFFQKRKRK